MTSTAVSGPNAAIRSGKRLFYAPIIENLWS